MAEAAVLQKIKTDILSCYICSAELQDPIGLPCLHGFCFECLETWHQDSKDKTHVICPACKKTTPVPKDGIRGFPRHFLVHNLQDTMDKKSAEPRKDIPCNICGQKADMHCSDCKKSLCQQCVMNHNQFIKDHHLADIVEFQSGQVSTEGRICPLHGEKVRYYCEKEDKQVCMDCISLKTCPIEHVRVTLKEAAKKQIDTLEQLTKKCADKKKNFQDAMKDSTALLGTLQESVKEAKLKAVQNKEARRQQVDQEFDKEIEKIEASEKDRVKEIRDKTLELESEIGKIEEAEIQAMNLTASDSDYLITYKYSPLSTLLNQLSLLDPVRPALSLASLQYETSELSLVPPGQHVMSSEPQQHESIPMAVPSGTQTLLQMKWRLAGSFPTKGMTKPCGIAIDNDGDIVVTSLTRGVKVYSRDGQIKGSFMDDSEMWEVAVSHDNRYIISGETYSGLRFFTNAGRRITSKPVLDVYDIESEVASVAVDVNDRIITGSIDNTVSIHYADGSLISQFARKKIFRVVPTYEGNLVVSSPFNHRLQIMDYSGRNVRLLQPPPEVKKWMPGHLCSAQGEVFVVNRKSGEAGIFRYTSNGEYLGCVSNDVKVPKGIALSWDGMQLYLVEHKDCMVKIFERE